MKNIWQKLKPPIIALAPMAGITDSAFRQVCKSFGADLVYTEMVSADGIVYGSEKTFDLMRFDKKERPIILQLFGKHPQNFAKAMEIIQKHPNASCLMPHAFDINMGCPARKVVSSGHGIALMKDVKLASEIVKALKESTRLPVSVKTRLGFEKKDEILLFGPRMEAAGADAICVHARMYKQGFSGPIDFGVMKKLKSKIKIPLIVSGGVYSAEDAKRTLELTGADGIMIGQGALGKPWIFKKIKDEIRQLGQVNKKGAKETRNKKQETKDTNYTNNTNKNDDVGWAQIKKTALKHAGLAYKTKGDHGIIEMRKHLAWYVRGQDKARELRRKLVRVETVEDIRKILKK